MENYNKSGMNSWKYNKVWCTKTNKFYTKEDLEKLTFEEFNDIREFFVCEYHNDVDINCQARMIARTKSVGRPKKPEEHFEIHCFATHKVDNHSRDCPYDYIKTIGSSYIVETELNDLNKLKIKSILVKAIENNKNINIAIQNAKKTSHNPKIDQNKEKIIGKSGVINKRHQIYVASKVLNIDEMNDWDEVTKKERLYFFRERKITIIPNIVPKDQYHLENTIYLNVYKNNQKLYWIAMGWIWYDKIIKDERFKNLIYSEKWTGDISFLGRKSRSKKSKKVSFWIKDPDLFIFNQTN